MALVTPAGTVHVSGAPLALKVTVQLWVAPLGSAGGGGGLGRAQARWREKLGDRQGQPAE